MLLHILIIIRNVFFIALQGIELELKYVMLFDQSLGHIFISLLLFTNTFYLSILGLMFMHDGVLFIFCLLW